MYAGGAQEGVSLEERLRRSSPAADSGTVSDSSAAPADTSATATVGE
jgi:hypothetical protein